jgi:hypothetical protein
VATSGAVGPVEKNTLVRVNHTLIKHQYELYVHTLELNAVLFVLTFVLCYLPKITNLYKP